MDEYSQALQFAGFSMHAVWILILLVILFVISALLSGSETALFSLTQDNIKDLKNDDSPRSKAALDLLDKPDVLLSTIVIGKYLFNIGAIIAASAFMSETFPMPNSPVLELIVKILAITFILLLFVELIPKSIAAHNAYSLARSVAVPLKVARAVFKPLSLPLIKSSGLTTRALARKQSVSIDDLQNAIRITDTDSAEDKRMLSGILRFVNTEVVEIMKPRIDVVTMEIEDDFDKVRETIISSGFSRLPVFEENLDHIKGVLYIKDLLPHIGEDRNFEWQKLLRQPYYVPEHKKINDLLEDFQTRKIHLSIVVDEYGGTLGIVTLEDILEEIVGEISDESDCEESCYEKLDEHTYIFEGSTSLGDFLRTLSLGDSYLDYVKGDADTVAGLMLEIKGEFLRPNDVVEYGNMTLRAEEVDHYRITKVKVTIGNAPDTE